MNDLKNTTNYELPTANRPWQSQGLPRSPYDKIHGLVYFLRMLDKIRLHAAGKLSADYVPNLGIKLDAICCRFLRVEYTQLVAMVTSGSSDEEVWEWCITHGKSHSQEEAHIWNSFMIKYGWRDEASEILQRRLKESRLENRTDIQTIFDYIDLDEGRGSI